MSAACGHGHALFHRPDKGGEEIRRVVFFFVFVVKETVRGGVEGRGGVRGGLGGWLRRGGGGAGRRGRMDAETVVRRKGLFSRLLRAGEREKRQGGRGLRQEGRARA